MIITKLWVPVQPLMDFADFLIRNNHPTKCRTKKSETNQVSGPSSPTGWWSMTSSQGVCGGIFCPFWEGWTWTLGSLKWWFYVNLSSDAIMRYECQQNIREITTYQWYEDHNARVTSSSVHPNPPKNPYLFLKISHVYVSSSQRPCPGMPIWPFAKYPV